MDPFSRVVPEELIKSLAKASRVVVLTGAGISAESGVPTFREAQTGLWAQYDPLELATPSAFQQNPSLVWEWYTWRRSIVSQAIPNPGHLAIAQLEVLLPDFTLITQNVDGLHRQAGSKNVVELHGNIRGNRCFLENISLDNADLGEGTPPLCPHCGGPVRPDVVWFGESLPHRAVDMALDVTRKSELFFSVGTSALVRPAAELPFEAIRHGATVVEINVSETPLTDYAAFFLQAPAGEVLPYLVQATFHK